MTEATGEKKPAQGGCDANDGARAGVDSAIHYGEAVLPKSYSPARDEADVLSAVHYGEAVVPKGL